jgi:uncharacterized protein DUF1801
LRIRRFDNAAVAAVFAAYPKEVRTQLLRLRELVFDTAAQTPGVGPLEETLRWGQPSYLTSKSKAGSTIRIDRVAAHAGRYAIYFHCRTSLVSDFKAMYPADFRYEGKRSIVFGADDKVPVKQLGHCIAMALTYHLSKK